MRILVGNKEFLLRILKENEIRKLRKFLEIRKFFERNKKPIKSKKWRIKIKKYKLFDGFWRA